MDTKILNEHLLTDKEKQEEIEIIKQKEKNLKGGKGDTSGLTEEEKAKLADSSLKTSGEVEKKKEEENNPGTGDIKDPSKNSSNDVRDLNAGDANLLSKEGTTIAKEGESTTVDSESNKLIKNGRDTNEINSDSTSKNLSLDLSKETISADSPNRKELETGEVVENKGTNGAGTVGENVGGSSVDKSTREGLDQTNSNLTLDPSLSGISPTTGDPLPASPCNTDCSKIQEKAKECLSTSDPSNNLNAVSNSQT